MITSGRHPLERPPQPASDGRSSGPQGRAAAYPDQAARSRNSQALSPGFREAPDSFRRGPQPPRPAAGSSGPAGSRPEAAAQPILSKPTLIISLGLHLVLILFLAFGLPSCQEKSGIPPEQVITVQLMNEPSPAPPPPAEPAHEAPEQPKPAPQPQQPPAFELPLGDSSRNLQRSGRAEADAEAVEELPAPAPPEDLIALAPKAQAPPPELEKRRERKPEVKPPEVKRRTEPKPPKEADYSNVPQALYRTLGRDAGAIHFGSRQGRRADPVVSRYFELALRKFNANWTAPPGLSPRLVVGFSLTIEPNGRITNVRLAQSSGSAEYDRSVERAIKMASPLQPLPPVFGGQRVSQVFSFTPEGMGGRRR